MRHGFGVLQSVGLGITYTGDWVHGKQHGKVSVLQYSLSDWSDDVKLVYMVCQIKRHQLSFLLVTSERIYRTGWFLMHTNNLKQQIARCQFILIESVTYKVKFGPPCMVATFSFSQSETMVCMCLEPEPQSKEVLSSVVISRPRSWDSRALEFILLRSWSRLDFGAKVSVSRAEWPRSSKRLKSTRKTDFSIKMAWRGHSRSIILRSLESR